MAVTPNCQNCASKAKCPLGKKGACGYYISEAEGSKRIKALKSEK